MRTSGGAEEQPLSLSHHVRESFEGTFMLLPLTLKALPERHLLRGSVCLGRGSETEFAAANHEVRDILSNSAIYD